MCSNKSGLFSGKKNSRTDCGRLGIRTKNKKRNQEFLAVERAHVDLVENIKSTLMGSNDFRLISQPKHIGNIIFSKYTSGMFYGDHIDNTIMSARSGQPWRSDMSFTLFVSDPNEYDGGELVLNTDVRPEPIKLPAGHMVIYSTLYLHRVNPVTRGTRLALVGWLQSLIRDPNQRQALLDIAQTIGFLQSNFPEGAEHREAVRLQKAYANIARMWSEI